MSHADLLHFVKEKDSEKLKETIFHMKIGEVVKIDDMKLLVKRIPLGFLYSHYEGAYSDRNIPMTFIPFD